MSSTLSEVHQSEQSSNEEDSPGRQLIESCPDILKSSQVKMERKQFGYSMKNIGIPSEKEYSVEFISSVNQFEARM